VVDASVLAALFLREAGWQEISARLDALTQVCSVPFFRFEVANAVWKRPEIPDSQAPTLAYMVFDFPVDDAFLPEVSTLSMRLARTHQLPFYDAAYIAQARARGLPLWTLDRRQAQVARLEHVEVIS
jgi:predicted nucleic acid-binding protein